VDDRGSASLEFLVAGLFLLVPIVYLIVALGLIQEGTLGVEAAARHTARAIGLAEHSADADRRAEQVLRDVAGEYGIPTDALAVELACPGTPGECPAAGATLSVTVRARIPLPLVPPVLGLDRLAVVPVEATSVQKTSRLWGNAP
jgi:hypothetical protein